MRLSKNFRLEEMLVSKTFPELIKAIHVPPSYKWNLFKLAKIHLQHIRDFIHRPLHITSGFRTKELNNRIGGSRNSQHLFGEAADCVVLNKDGSTDKECMDTVHQYIQGELFHSVGECIDYRDENNAIRFIHISLPDPRYHKVFRTIIRK